MIDITNKTNIELDAIMINVEVKAEQKNLGVSFEDMFSVTILDTWNNKQYAIEITFCGGCSFTPNSRKYANAKIIAKEIQNTVESPVIFKDIILS